MAAINVPENLGSILNEINRRLRMLETSPGSSAFSSAEQGLQSDVVDATESTTSTSFVNLATTGPVVSAVASDIGKIILIVSASMFSNAAGAVPYMSAEQIATDPDTGLETGVTANTWAVTGVANSWMQASRVSVVDQNPGWLYTYTAKYKTNAAGTAQFHNRSLIAIPL